MNTNKAVTVVATALLVTIGLVGCAEEETDPCAWRASANEYQEQTGRELDLSGCEQQGEVDIDVPKAKKRTSKSTKSTKR